MSSIAAFPPADPRKPIAFQLALAAGALIALGGLGYLYFSSMQQRGESQPLATATETRTSEPKAAAESQALLAIKKGHFVAPAGDNALELYLAELDADPASQSASQAVMELLPLASDALAVALARGDASEHARLLALLTRADPKSPMLGSFQSAWDQRQVAAAAATSAAAATLLPSANAPTVLAQTPAEAQQAVLTETPPIRELAKAEPPTERAVPAIARVPQPKRVPAPTPAIDSEIVKPLLKVVEPILVSAPAAQYPSSAKRQKIEGWVEFKLTLDREGRVTDAQIVSAEPNRLFDVEARRAVMRWRFAPKRVDNVAVEAVVRQRLSFKLRA